MTGNLVAPRPVRILSSLQLPFFLSNALYSSNVPNPVLHASANVPLPEPAEADVPPGPPEPAPPAESTPSAPSASANQSKPEASNLKSTLSPTESDQNEKSIEELAASIRLDDEPQAQYAHYPNQNPQNQYNRPPSTSLLFGLRSSATSPPASARSILEDGPPATPRSAETAVLEEFLSILRPVITSRAPSSPIARSKRLLPRSRHHHHHHGHGHGHGLAPSSDRHHPYARTAKSTSPSYDSHSHSHGGDVNSGTKRSLLSCGRSSATTYARRRSSNANESTHSHGSTSMSSSRSQSISRNGSDNSSDEFNAWRPISPPNVINDVNMQMDIFNDQDQEPGPGPDSGPGTTGASLLVLAGPSSHPHIASPDQQ